MVVEFSRHAKKRLKRIDSSISDVVRDIHGAKEMKKIGAEINDVRYEIKGELGTYRVSYKNNGYKMVVITVLWPDYDSKEKHIKKKHKLLRWLNLKEKGYLPRFKV